ncbi:head maturation protease, ClpP-related [Paraburkholderia terricola]|uniref:ATP-dependent Clp protease proteolytic subunit n=1 Tax=Paraburkholderia terricola TaxID=169427 RepID=A0A1M6YQA0_9BURK|nr:MULTISPECIES: head maturation protease, ClpP-related [Paraburkholderia]SDO12298.1 ATP-dependent protease ClpP, protease subunit [Paraburkholderia sediminicola]SHL20494.1 ATP-dependent protease ClpP, protease subunit [Paraburkholderia terricola]
MKNRKWWDIRAMTNAQGAAVAEIRIYDEIGFWGTDAKTFIAQLDAAAASATEVIVAVNSPGGDVFDAFAIYNALRRYAGKVTARVDGVAASAAGLVVMAGDQVVMPENAMLMIHNPWTIALGSAADLRSTADMMDKARDGILAAYRRKSGQTDEALTAMMDAETWLTALEAQSLGFCDVIEEPVRLAASTNAAGLLARFRNPPEPVQALVEAEGDASSPPADPPSNDPPVNDPPPPIPPEPAAPGLNPLPAENPPAPAPQDPGPVAVREEPGVLAAHVFNACRAANLSMCAESIVTLTALKDRATIDAAIRNATDIAGLCLAAKLPELTAQFVGDGLNPDQVRARLFDRVTQSQPRVNNRQQPAPNDAGRSSTGPKASSIYAARQGATK